MADPNPLMMFGEPIGPWHDWFAWFPIRTYDQRFAWFRWVRRRCIQKHQYLTGGSDFWWQYHAEPHHPHTAEKVTQGGKSE